MSAPEFCRTRGIGYSSFRNWKQKVESKERIKIPVVGNDVGPEKRADSMRLIFFGAELILPESALPENLKSVVSELETEWNVR